MVTGQIDTCITAVIEERRLLNYLRDNFAYLQ